MKHLYLLPLFFILACSQFVLGAGEVVEAEGFGLTFAEAEKSALNQAVRESLGSLISSRTEINNDQVIEDRIIIVSGGYVSDYDIISSSPPVNGIFRLTIRAEVQTNQLSDALNNLAIPIATPAEIKAPAIRAAALSKLHDRREATKMSVILFQRRLNVTRIDPIDHNYNEITEIFKIKVRFETAQPEWNDYYDTSEKILDKISLKQVKMIAPAVALRPKYVENQFVSLGQEVIDAVEHPRMAREIPSFATACSLSPLFENEIQTSEPNSWVLWFQFQSTRTGTLRKGYLMRTDPTVLFPFLSRSSHLRTEITDQIGNVVVTQTTPLRPTLRNTVYDAEIADTGIFATSSSGTPLYSGPDVTVKERSMANINEFWENNQLQDSDRLNIFITRQPTIYTPIDYCDDLVHKTATDTKHVLRILSSHEPNPTSPLGSGCTVERRLPITLADWGNNSKFDTHIDFNYKQERLLEFLRHEFGTDPKLNLNGPNGAATLTLNEATFTPGTNFLIFGEISNLQTLNLRNTNKTNLCLEQVKLMPSLVTLDLSSSDVNVMDIERLTSLNRLQTLILDNDNIDAAKIEVLARIASLKTLSLENPTDEKVGLLFKMKQLRTLVLDDNDEITDACVSDLRKMKFLTKLSIIDTKISDAGISQLKNTLLGCNVIHN